MRTRDEMLRDPRDGDTFSTKYVMLAAVVSHDSRGYERIRIIESASDHGRVMERIPVADGYYQPDGLPTERGVYRLRFSEVAIYSAWMGRLKWCYHWEDLDVERVGDLPELSA